jgi:hypothetical protein
MSTKQLEANCSEAEALRRKTGLKQPDLRPSD